MEKKRKGPWGDGEEEGEEDGKGPRGDREGKGGVERGGHRIKYKPPLW